MKRVSEFLAILLTAGLLLSACDNIGTAPPDEENATTLALGKKGPKPMVTVCHEPGTEDEKTLTLPELAAMAHLRHGDTIGPCGLVLWNTLGSDEEVLNSLVGPDLEFYDDPYPWPEVQGDRTYMPAHDGYGVTLAGTYTNMSRIHNLELNNLGAVIDPEHGAIDFWYLQNDVPVIYSHGVYRFFGGAMGWDPLQVSGEPGSGMGFHAVHGSPPDIPIQFFLVLGGTWNMIQFDAASIPPGQWTHMAAVWDRAGIDGSPETMRLYADGVLVAAGTGNDWGTSVGPRVDICGGNDHNIIDKFAMDELRVWNYAKTDF